MLKDTILFIVNDFYPGGAQREMYEIDLYCKKHMVKNEILVRYDLKEHSYFPDFFYDKHLELGTNIVFLNSIVNRKPHHFHIRIIKKVQKKLTTQKTNPLLKYLRSFKKVIFMGEYILAPYQNLLDDLLVDPVNLVVMSSRFQGEHYRSLNKKLNYNIFSGFGKQEEISFEFEGFQKYIHHYFPLSIENLNEDQKQWKYNNIGAQKIGVFTRLSKAKPLDPFFYTFHLLQKNRPNLELHVFGAGDPNEAEYTRYIKHLDLKNVYFRGHQVDIKSILNKENLNLVWFQGYLDRPAGYAGFDVALSGTPQLFWDFFTGENPMINRIDSIYPHFKSISELANATLSVLDNVECAEALAQKQFKDVLSNRSMEKNLNNIPDFLN
jgi:glycosyltransferase involved in cell wall biosynthesis